MTPNQDLSERIRASWRWLVRAGLVLLAVGVALPAAISAPRTVVTIAGDQFLINGRPTYPGRTWRGHKVEGLLMNARLVQGVFDDLNPATAGRWAYPDTGKWDAGRNTDEFIAAMPAWRAHGLLAFTINFQGGSPEGYSRGQPWINSAFRPDGSPEPAYFARMQRIIGRADELGMAVILGYFYFGQDQRLADEAAVLRAVDHTTRWVLDHGWRHVLVEVNNECDINYDHAILQPARVPELIRRIQGMTSPDGHRLLVSTSFKGDTVPTVPVVRAADFILLHGNAVKIPGRIAELVRLTRQLPGYTPKPVVFNEDDHFAFEEPANNFTAALGEHASWGYFDFRMKDEDFPDGYQSVPVDWGIRSARKTAFFRLLAEITGHTPPPGAE